MGVIAWLVGLFIAMPLIVLGPVMALYGIVEVDGPLTLAGVLLTGVAGLTVEWAKKYW